MNGANPENVILENPQYRNSDTYYAKWKDTWLTIDFKGESFDIAAIGVDNGYTSSSTYSYDISSVTVSTLDANGDWTKHGTHETSWEKHWSTKRFLIGKEEVPTTKMKFELHNKRHNQTQIARIRFYVLKD